MFASKRKKGGGTITNEELNTELYQKMYEEQERFKEVLRNVSSQEVMLNAYELVIREDILLYMEEHDLSDAQVKALLISEHPLSDIFEKWENHEGQHMHEIGETIESLANELIRENKARTDKESR